MMYLGSRCLLPADSPFRQQRCGVYEFIDEERRPPAVKRTTAMMRTCLQIAKDEDLNHVCGFASDPMFDQRVDFDYVLDSATDWMHLLGRLFRFFVDVIFGGRGPSSRAKKWSASGKDQKHRVECQMLGLFRAIWPVEQKLSDEQREALLRPTDDDILHATRTNLERWAHAVGEDTRGLLVNDLVLRVMQIRQRLRQPGDYFFLPRRPVPLPWRVSLEAFNEVDRRIRAMVYPHNTERVINKDGRSFLRLTEASNKHSKKILALLVILPTVLRGFIQALRRGLRLFVLGLRMLEGQVHSFNECRRLGVEPGSRCLDNSKIPTIKKLILIGLAIIEGSVPPSTLIPYLHIASN